MRELKHIHWYRRLILYSAACLFLFLTLAYLTASFALAAPLPPFLGVLRDFLLSFYPNIALVFFTFLFTILFYLPIREADREIEEERLLKKFEGRLTSQLYEMVIRAQTVTASLRRSGVIEVIEQLNDMMIRTRIAQSRNRICILDTWTFHTLSELEDVFLQAIHNGASIQILLLDPDSTIARQRSLDLDHDEEHVPSTIRANMRVLKVFCQKHQIKQQLEVRYYHRLPSLQLYICDRQALVGFFWHRGTSLGGPQLDILMQNDAQEYTVLGKRIELEFVVLWQHALIMPVD